MNKNNAVEETASRASTDLMQTVTASDFDERVLHAQGPVAVEFMSYGCGHCRAIEPVLQKVAKEVSSTIKICRVNVAVDQELTDSYAIQGTPTFVMFLNGREVNRVEGPSPTFRAVLAVVSKPFES